MLPTSRTSTCLPRHEQSRLRSGLGQKPTGGACYQSTCTKQAESVRLLAVRPARCIRGADRAVHRPLQRPIFSTFQVLTMHTDTTRFVSSKLRPNGIAAIRRHPVLPCPVGKDVQAAPTSETRLHHNHDPAPSAARRMRHLSVVSGLVQRPGLERLRTDVTGGICPLLCAALWGLGVMGPCWSSNLALVDVSSHPKQHTSTNSGRST